MGIAAFVVGDGEFEELFMGVRADAGDEAGEKVMFGFASCDCD